MKQLLFIGVFSSLIFCSCETRCDIYNENGDALDIGDGRYLKTYFLFFGLLPYFQI